MSDTRECPSCALEAPTDTDTCPYCGYEFPEQPASRIWMAWLFAVLLLFWALDSFIFHVIF